MNPIKWIRWKVVIVLAVVVGTLYFLGLNPLATRQINGLGNTSKAARWAVDGVDLGFLAGDFELSNLFVATAEAAEAAATQVEKSEVFSAITTNFDLSMNHLSRKRFVVEEVAIDTPRLSVDRRPDGSTNIGDLGGDDSESPDDEGPDTTDDEPTDWYESAKKWYERIEKLREKMSGDDDDESKDDDPGATDESGASEIDYYARRVVYPFLSRPTMIVERVVAKGLEIDFSESKAEADSTGDTASGSFAKLSNGNLSLTGLSNRPSKHSEPIRLTLDGTLGTSPLRLEANVDLTKPLSSYSLTFDSGEIPASIISSFVGESLPVSIAKGTIRVRVDQMSLQGDDSIQLKPVLTFRGVELATRDGAQVAGQSATAFVNAFNEASRAMGEEALEIADLRIDGTLERPQLHWGDTVKNLVLKGGEAFARQQLAKIQAKADALIDEGKAKIDAERERLAKEADALIDAEKEKMKDKLEAELEKSGVGEQLQGEIEKVLPGGLPGFGGAKKNDASAADESSAGEASGEGADDSSEEGSSLDESTKDALDDAADKLKDGIFGRFGGSEK